MTATNSSAAAQLVLPGQYVQTRQNIFPSVDAFRWFERQHRAELVECGALLMPAGRKLVDPAAFDAVVVDIGKRMASKRCRS